MAHGSNIRSAAASSLLLLLGCGGEPATAPPPATLLDQPLAELPAKLSEVGIYEDTSQHALSARALVYEPAYPLWSDGGDKQRALVLPPGSSIDARDPAAYEFPVGSLIFKTFAFRTPSSPDQRVPVETRVLRLGADGWDYAAYAWDDAGHDAELQDLRRARQRDVLDDDGNLVAHAIPSRLECRQCHESSATTVLGITELQLATSEAFSRLSARLEPRPREPYAALPEHGPLTRAALGYFVGNCVHCHNGSNGAASSFDLRPERALDNVIDQPTASSATADGIRVTPGEPERSILYLAMRGGDDREVKDMPPLGVAARDVRGITRIGDWITALGEDQDP